MNAAAAQLDPMIMMSARHRLLRAEEEVALAIAIEAGLFAQQRLEAGAMPGARAAELMAIARAGAAAYEEFVSCNVRLSVWFARRIYRHADECGVSFDDLVSEGVLGVIRAVQKWDYTRGLKFSTYAVYWVRQFQQRLIMRAGSLGLTFDEQQQCRRMAQVRELLEHQLRRTPALHEIAEEMGTTRRRVQQLLAMQRRPASLDQPIGDQGRVTVGDQLADPACELEEHAPAPWAQVADPTALLEILDARERAVVIELFGLRDGVAQTIEDVARARRVPPDLVSRTAQSALRKLRSAAGLDEAA